MTPKSTPNTVHHIEWHSSQSADEVHAQLLATLPKLDHSLTHKAREGDTAWVEQQRRDGPPLWLFEVRDQGSMLALEHRRSGVIQYEIGNPLTAESMVRYQSAAGMYAPLRVILYDVDGGSVLAYDLPSDQFGQFGDDRVTKVGHDLDREIEAVVRRALTPPALE